MDPICRAFGGEADSGWGRRIQGGQATATTASRVDRDLDGFQGAQSGAVVVRGGKGDRIGAAAYIAVGGCPAEQAAAIAVVGEGGSGWKRGGIQDQGGRSIRVGGRDCEAQRLPLGNGSVADGGERWRLVGRDCGAGKCRASQRDVAGRPIVIDEGIRDQQGLPGAGGGKGDSDFPVNDAGWVVDHDAGGRGRAIAEGEIQASPGLPPAGIEGQGA